MADYYPLIAKAVAGLDKSTGEARRALYERARNALVTQLRNVSPALTESDITRERLALEEAVRKVEAEAARKSRFDPPPERKRVELDNSFKPTAPQPLRQTSPPQPAASNEETNAEQNSLRPSRTPAGTPLSGDGLKGFRQVVAEGENAGEVTAQASRSAREPLNAMPSPTPEVDRLEPRTEPESSRARRVPVRDPAQTRDPASPRQSPTPPEPSPGRDFLARGPTLREPSPPERAALRLPALRERPARRDGMAPRETQFERPGGEPARTNESSEGDFAPGHDFDAERNAQAEPDSAFDAAPARGRMRRRVEEPEVGEETTAPPTRMRERVFAYAAIVAVLAALAGIVVWQWQPMVGAVRGLVARTQTTPTPPQPVPQTTSPKITDRIGSNDTAPAPQQQQAADVAQRVVLYEEDPEDAAGKRFVGTAVWRTEQVSPGAGQPPETVVRADIDIPDRKMTMKWSLRRNTDKTLPASHTVEVVFALPPDFPHQGVQNVPGVLMKEAEQQRGVPLSGSAVKVTDGYFLIGLSAVDSEMQRNVQLLKERPWFDVPIVYGDGRRAILAVEKGTPGERAFTDAFAAWKQ